MPPPRPKGLTPQVQEQVQEQVHERQGPPKPEAQEGKAASPSEADLACIGRLEALGLKFEKRPPVEENDCRLGNPVSVLALANGVDVAPDSLMECQYAETLAHWVGDVVGPRAKEHFQSAPTRLLIGTSYQCRDQRSGGKRSEHAFGNGVDVMGFEFDKRSPLTITFQPEGSPEAAFQSAIHKGACEIFKTVLGPGADADHGNHLHLDMRARKNDYRICQ
ncbi:extensin family protein [Microvirga sp. TS319]|uniref:extensin-like domain-containing protein n=1 Tax=Microvirga sp. TS319 TaxID=3241165 RepID=UPI00351AA257